MNQLRISTLHKTYRNGVKALNNVSLEIGNGLFGLLGPNGAGKSSLMKIIAGLEPADSGEISFNNNSVLKNPDFLKRQLGFLPQDFGVFPHVSAFDLLNHIAILKGLTRKKERVEQVTALLDRMNLFEHRKKDVHTFSGGMKQRFGIAQSLLGQPKLIIVDEPTAGLDPEERNRFNNLLCELGDDVVVLLSTHLVEDVRNLCRQMAILCEGKLISKGTPVQAIESLRGKIWRSTHLSRSELKINSEHTVLTTRFHMGNRITYVFCNEKPADWFESAEPELEDLYFFALSQHR